MCSDPVRSWRESLERDLTDLYVPDLSVCDSLIAEGFISDDDCQVLNKTKRNKSKVKRLIGILCKTKDPKSAFYALSECIATTHSHLTDRIRKAAEHFPEPDINSNVYHSGVEHDEYGYTFASKCREPVQHDEISGEYDNFDPSQDLESNHTVIKTSNIMVKDTGRYRDKSFLGSYCLYDIENNFQRSCDNLTRAVTYDNQDDLSNNCYEFDKLKSLEHNTGDFNTESGFGICEKEKGITSHGIQGTDVDLEASASGLQTLKTYNSKNENSYDNRNLRACEHSYSSLHCSQDWDDVDGIVPGVLFESRDSENDLTDGAVELQDKTELLSNGEVRNIFDGHLATQNSFVKETTASSSITLGSATNNYSFFPSVQNLTKQQLCTDLVGDEKSCSCFFDKNYQSSIIHDTHNPSCVASDHTHIISDSTNLDTIPIRESKLDQTHNSSQKNSSCHSDNNPGDIDNHIVCKCDDDVVKPTSSVAEMCETNKEQLHQFSHSSLESQNNVKYRLKVCSNSRLVSDNKSDEKTKQSCRKKTESKILFKIPSNSQRALSQIDHSSAVVSDQCVKRVQSWACTRTKSRVFEGFTSSSEDYTTTDLNYSDLNEIEKELCDKLEMSGSITDLVDRLIEEEYFSNDDWSAVNEIRVKRDQATYVAKRISNIIQSEGDQSFSKLLKSQPKLCTWLSSKFQSSLGKTSTNDTEFKSSGSQHYENSSDENNSSIPDSGFSSGCCAKSIGYLFDDNECENSDVAVYKQDQKQKDIYARPNILGPAEIVADKHFQKVFDSLNTEFNKGTLPVTKLPRDPNAKCVVLYLKACDALYKAEYEDAERFIKLADAAINDTDCPLFMRSEIFTQKTWLCLNTNRLGVMGKLLEENEQFLLANPKLWSNKAVGWFYFDYGRFNVTMMNVTKPIRPRRHKNVTTLSRSAYEIYQEKAKKCLRKSIQYFAHSDSSDGPIGMGFSLSLLARIELQCIREDSFIHAPPLEPNVKEAEKILLTVANLYEEIPGILNASYLLAKSELCFRKNELTAAKEHLDKCFELSTELDLREELKACAKIKRMYNQFA